MRIIALFSLILAFVMAPAISFIGDAAPSSAYADEKDKDKDKDKMKDQKKDKKKDKKLSDVSAFGTY